MARLAGAGHSRYKISIEISARDLDEGPLESMQESDQGESIDATAQTHSDGNSIIALFGFSALYPALHYVLNNLDVFTFSIAIQFAIVASVIPLGAWLGLRLLVRRFVSQRIFFALNLIAAMAIFSWSMLPFLRQFPIWVSRTTGFDADTALRVLVWAPVILIAFALGVRFRPVLAMFLSVMLLVTAANAAYSLYASGGARARRPSGEEIGDSLAGTFDAKPSLYILVVDGYLNQAGLEAKGLASLDVGPELAARGFRVYTEAYSNYKPSSPSMTSFFDIRHHYYQPYTEWADHLTGGNKFYWNLRSNGYTTVTAHPSDFLLRGHCKSDFCYPAPSIFGQLGFVLAETLFYSPDFTVRTSVGMDQYKTDLYALLEETPAPAVFYSHVSWPNHGPNGCNEPQAALDKYERGLVAANNWIQGAINEIESFDEDAIIVFMGDHGAFLSDHCTWNNPNAQSRDVVIDNLGVLLAVKWPTTYDGRYDDRIHSPMDLSWYFLQYLSGDAMDEEDKPASASYLYNPTEKLVYEVVRDGELVPEPEGVKWSDAGKHWLREEKPAVAP